MTPEDYDRDKLEHIVDRMSLVSVLEMLSTICYLKSERMYEDQPESVKAKVWSRASAAIYAASMKIGDI